MVFTPTAAQLAAPPPSYPYMANFTSSGTFTALCASCVHTVLLVGGGGAGGSCDGSAT